MIYTLTKVLDDLGASCVATEIWLYSIANETGPHCIIFPGEDLFLAKRLGIQRMLLRFGYMPVCGLSSA
jgi:hypothetical protein